MKKMREDTIFRTERYSELINNEQNSKDIFLKIEETNKKRKKI